MKCLCPLCDNVIRPVKGVRLIPEAKLVVWNGGYVKFTNAQFIIFSYIHAAYPQRVTLERLAMHYYVKYRDPDDPPGNDLIRVQISLIRKKLKDANAPISIPHNKQYGVGYVVRFEQEAQSA